MSNRPNGSQDYAEFTTAGYLLMVSTYVRYFFFPWHGQFQAAFLHRPSRAPFITTKFRNVILPKVSSQPNPLERLRTQQINMPQNSLSTLVHVRIQKKGEKNEKEKITKHFKKFSSVPFLPYNLKISKECVKVCFLKPFKCLPLCPNKYYFRSFL